MMMALFATLAPLVVGDAFAATGLVWTWPDGEARTWHAVADVTVPKLVDFKALNNTDVRIGRFRVELVTTCKKVGLSGKDAFDIKCMIDDVGLQAAPVRPDAGRVLPVLTEFDDSFRGSFLELTMTTDGRIKAVGLEGVNDRVRRYREIETVMRLVVVRAIAGLDLQLPKNGDDKGTSWRMIKSLAMNFVADTGTVGSLEGVSAITKTDGDIVVIESKATGTLGSGEEYLENGQPQLSNLYDMNLQSAATFDTAKGFLLDRTYRVDGNVTAGSLDATGSQGSSYIQELKLTFVAPGTTVQIEDNAELPPLGTVL